ncbi:MAG: DGQHR domain-containing protein [Pyrinomonadaceae bacterium]|nr:DGQHR domain-containing protein [Pyrinomonadaceae bacterium]
MRIPALRAHMGDWTYYVTTLTFEEVGNFVSKVDNELHKSKSLRDLIQRSISTNYIGIKEYVINQSELFFNSLVLAVYDEYPDWREIEFKYEGGETYQMGILEFSKVHKIFPVDGQHRVEGIKAALKEKPELKHQRIATIFIGHKNDESGMRRTRRLFTTLNRYAKPVKLDDIIALDEDDIVAITTRYLLEEYDLFTGKRVVVTKQKAIPSNNKDAITSIITLYQANIELFNSFYETLFNKKITPKSREKYLKFRPDQKEINSFQEFCINYWNAFKTQLNFISDFVVATENPAQPFRDSKTGGNLVFRPIGFLPLVKASLIIHNRKGQKFTEIFEQFNTVNFNLDSKPWHFVAWNPKETRMLTESVIIIQLLLLYLYDGTILTEDELKKLKEGYASKVAPDTEDIENVLVGIK